MSGFTNDNQPPQPRLRRNQSISLGDGATPQQRKGANVFGFIPESSPSRQHTSSSSSSNSSFQSPLPTEKTNPLRRDTEQRHNKARENYGEITGYHGSSFDMSSLLPAKARTEGKENVNFLNLYNVVAEYFKDQIIEIKGGEFQTLKNSHDIYYELQKNKYSNMKTRSLNTYEKWVNVDISEYTTNLDGLFKTYENDTDKLKNELFIQLPVIIKRLYSQNSDNENKLLMSLYALYFYYKRSDETTQFIKDFFRNRYMSTPAIKQARKNEIARDAKNSYEKGGFTNFPSPPRNNSGYSKPVVNADSVDEQQDIRDQILRTELINIIRESILPNSSVEGLNPVRIDEFKEGNNDSLKIDSDVTHEEVREGEEQGKDVVGDITNIEDYFNNISRLKPDVTNIIMNAMSDSDNLITVVDGNINTSSELEKKSSDSEKKPSDLEQLASELGGQYMRENLQGGIEVETKVQNEKGIETTQTDRVIIGTKMEIKGFQNTAKKEEEKIVCILDKDTGNGIDHPRRSSRTKKTLEKLEQNQEEPKKREKKTVEKQQLVKQDGEYVQGTSVFSASTSTFSKAGSQIILDLVNSDPNLKISIDELIGGDLKGTNSSQIYTKLLYYTCQLRPSTADFQQPTAAEARGAAATGISEKTQFADIWGPWVFNYASGQPERNGEDGSQPVKCYICKQNLVPFSQKVKWGNKGKERSCSEMEHTLPCITAFTQAPIYILLNKYKHNGEGYLKLWRKFTEDKYGDDGDDSIYKNMKELYQMINEYDKFDESIIEQKLENLMTKFKQHCVTFGGPVHDPTFNWVIEVIKYWLFEFSYAHHICNQVKSNRDIENTKEMKSYLVETSKRWKTNLDAIDNGERKYVIYKDANYNGTDTIKKKFDLNTQSNRENLKKRFEMMRSFSGTKGKGGSIRHTYKNITRIPIEVTEDDKIDIMTVMVTKGMIMMYKYYKREKLRKPSSSTKPKPTKQKTNQMSLAAAMGLKEVEPQSKGDRKRMLEFGDREGNNKKSNTYTSAQTVGRNLKRKGPPGKGKRKRGGTIKRKQNRRNQRTIKRKVKKNRKQRTIKRKQNKRKQRTIKKQKK